MPRSKCGSPLRQVGRRQQDRDPPGVGPPELAVGDRRPAPVARLVDRRVGPAHQRRADQPVGQVDLDVDHVPDGALQRHGVRRRDHQPTPRTCSTSAAPRSASSTPTRSIRIPSWRTSCSSTHRSGEPPQPFGLGGGDRLQRMAVGRGGARLHLAEDEHVPVAQDQVDLAVVAPPVAVDHHHPGLDQVSRGDALAVGTDAVVVWTATHAEQHTSACGQPRGVSERPPVDERVRTQGLWTRSGVGRYLIRRTGSPMTVASQVVTSCTPPVAEADVDLVPAALAARRSCSCSRSGSGW